MCNFIGKTVYLGIDVHKTSFSVTAVVDQEVVKHDKISADPLALVNYCKKHFPLAKLESAYEAGFSGFHLHRFLIAHGIENKVVHPASIEVSSRDRVKTDKRDSRKIAVQLAVGRLRCIHIPSFEREQYRSLTRLRESLVRYRKRTGCQLKSLLMQQAWAWPCEYPLLSMTWVKSMIKKAQEIKKRQFEIGYTIEQLGTTWLEFDQKMKAVEKQMEVQAEEDPLETVYRSVPGIGPVSARVLANELGDMSQFDNEKQLFSFTGLTPCEYSSGERRRLGHISRQGRSLVRKTLVQVAWTSIKIDPALEEDFIRIGKNTGPKRAIVAVARRLVGRIRSCFKNNTLYKTRLPAIVCNS
jgi:transposase